MVSPADNYLVISTLGSYSPYIINELTRAATQCGCNILNTNLNILGQELSIVLLVSGNWGAIAKLEATLPSLEVKLGFTYQSRRTSAMISNGKAIPYTIQISAIDIPGILSGMAEFLYKLNIPIQEIIANTFNTNTATRMANLSIRINVPDKVHLATLREQFISYCDDNNLDAFLEPIRNF